MPASRTTRTRPRRPRWALVLVSALAVVAAAVLPAAGAFADRPGGTSPVATPDNITMTLQGGLVLPKASGSPDVLISQSDTFTAVVTFRAGTLEMPYSEKTSTDVAITRPDGTEVGIATVPAGEPSGTVSGLQLTAANGVTLTARAVDRKASALTAGTVGPFDVVTTAKSVTQSGDLTLLVNAAGSSACTATPSTPTCVDVLLPKGTGSEVFFSTGPCSGGVGCATNGGTVLQVLTDLGSRYSATSTATLIFRCDKTLCGGGSIRSHPLLVNLDPPYLPGAPGPRALLEASPACGSKGYMDGPDGHCVDYVQSRRDGTGDTYLYLLITRDARMSI